MLKNLDGTWKGAICQTVIVSKKNKRSILSNSQLPLGVLEFDSIPGDDQLQYEYEGLALYVGLEGE